MKAADEWKAMLERVTPERRDQLVKGRRRSLASELLVKETRDQHWISKMTLWQAHNAIDFISESIGMEKDALVEAIIAHSDSKSASCTDQTQETI